MSIILISLYIPEGVCQALITSNSMLEAYELNMNPFEDDNNIAESSAMGAKNNKPPKIPFNFGITDPSNNSENSNDSTIRKSYYDTRYDENHNELCPVTQEFIGNNGECPIHKEAPCVDEDPFNVALPTDPEGY